MTIEELKALAVRAEVEDDLTPEIDLGRYMGRLAPEILALVEAVRFEASPRSDLPYKVEEAFNAFNAKLEAL